MFTEKQYLTSITGIELDQYLDRGWYRMGQIIFTCHFLFLEKNLYSPIWMRLPLKKYTLRKSLRKIKRQVESQFRVEVRPGNIDPFKEELYQQYRQSFRGDLAKTLFASLQDNSPFNVYNSMSVEVYHGKKLIAFSFFDVGKKSIASIQGVYNPAYSSHSLGFYTMIREMQYGIEHGFEIYYPGYIVPGFDRFDYKLRIAQKEELEFYNLKSRSWLNFNLFSKENIPLEILSHKLMELGWLMAKEKINCQILYYPAYDATVFGYDKEGLIDSPLFLNMFIENFQLPKFIAFYDIWKEKYIFCHTVTFEEVGHCFDFSRQDDHSSARQFLDFIIAQPKIIETDETAKIVAIAKSIQPLLRQRG